MDDGPCGENVAPGEEEGGGGEEEGNEDISHYLQDVLGEDFDSSFMAEFKSSELYLDFMKELSCTNGTTIALSRRPSHESNQSEARSAQNETQSNHSSLASQSTKKATKKNSDKEKPSSGDDQVNFNDDPYPEVAHSSKAPNSAEVATKIRDKLKICLRPSGSPKKEKKHKPPKPSSKDSRLPKIPKTPLPNLQNNTTSEPKFEEVITQSGATSSSSTGPSIKKQENVAGNKAKAISLESKCEVVLWDLKLMKRIFPDGIQSRLQASLVLCAQIKDCERQLKKAKFVNKFSVAKNGKIAKESIPSTTEYLTVPFMNTTTQPQKHTSPSLHSPSKPYVSKSKSKLGMLAKEVKDTHQSVDSAQKDRTQEHQTQSKASNVKKALDVKEDTKKTSDLKKDAKKTLDVKKDTKKTSGNKEDTNKTLDLKKDAIKTLDVEEDTKKASGIKEGTKETLDFKKDAKNTLGAKEDTKKASGTKEDTKKTLDLKKDAKKIFDVKEDTEKASNVKEDAKKTLDVTENTLKILDTATATIPSKAKPALSISLASIKSFISPKKPMRTEVKLPRSAKIQNDVEEILNNVPCTTDSKQPQEISSIERQDGDKQSENKPVICKDESCESMQLADQSVDAQGTTVELTREVIKDTNTTQPVPTVLDDNTVGNVEVAEDILTEGVIGDDTLDAGIAKITAENKDNITEKATRLDDSTALADNNEMETFESSMDLPNSPEIVEGSSADETPTLAIRKSPAPERAVPPKRKKFIESSSDDGERKDDGDQSSDPKKSSDEDGKSNARACSFERKKDEGDSRSKKFDRFEHERRRKLGETKKEKKEKQRNIIDTLEEFLKEKPLTGSFRIPKKACGSSRRHEPTSVATPLAGVFVPKENLQFERSRKGKSKDRDNDWYNNKFKREPIEHAKVPPVEREVYLLPDEEDKNNKGGATPTPVTVPAELVEPSWDDEPEGGSCGVGGGGNSDNGDVKDIVNRNLDVPIEENWDDEVVENVEVKPTPCSSNSSKTKIIATSIAVVENDENEEVDFFNPEVPLPGPLVNPFSIGLVTLMKQSEVLDLPDVDEIKDLAETTIKKLSWWFARIDPDSAYVDVNMPSPESDDDSSSSEQSYLAALDFSSEEDDLQTVAGERKVVGPVGEYCGRALLQAKYRLGRGDKFVPIFQIRSGASYEKEKFQAECTLCNVLVIGKAHLGQHVTSGSHLDKMATAGMEELKQDTEKKSDEVKESRKEKHESDSRRKEGKDTSEECDSLKKKNGEGKVKDKDTDRKREDQKPEKRKRSTDHSPAEKSRDKGRRRSRSRGRRSRSRSPRHKRTRACSPGRKSKVPRSRTPVQRIPRSPTRLEEQRRRMERRSTSAERVEKFLARTNKNVRKHSRRSQSPDNGVQVVLKRDNKEFNEKLALTAEGKWTPIMEQRWKLMEAEEAIFMEQFGEKRKRFTEVPENYPTYGDEWTLFWEQRFQELEQKGVDPDSHDFVPEWKEFWSKRLKTLLEVEYDNGIKDIKRRHGMDFETLQKLHANHESSKPTKVEPVDEKPLMPMPMAVPNPVPAPDIVSPNPSVRSMQQEVPQPIPPPRPASVVLSTKNFSGSGEREDRTARSMSISDDDRSTGSAGKQSTPTVTTGDVISQWEKLKSGGVPTRPSGSSVTSPWNNMSVAKSVGGLSNVDSGSIASFDFDGFDLVQVLRLMSNLEDQLSFFAPKVKEYFRKAEELELKKRNKSYVLLDDEDLVVMLFLVRDRFMVMIRANILPKDVLKSLNLTVYALNAILDSAQCQKHRSKAVSAAATTVEDKPEVTAQRNVISGANLDSETPCGSVENVGNNKTLSSEELASALMKTSSAQKVKIAELLTTFLLSMGREDMSDKELREFVLHAMSCSPTIGLSHQLSSSNQDASAPALSGKETREGRTSETFELSRNKEKTLSSNSSWAIADGGMTKTYSVATSRAVGGSYPPNSHAVSAPDYTGRISHTRPIDDRGRMMGRESNSGASSNESGKQSPFSKRNYSGNPGAEPIIHLSTQSRFPRPPSHEFICANEHFSRPTSFIKTLPAYRHAEPSVANVVRSKQSTETALSNQTSMKVPGCESLASNTNQITSNLANLPPGIINLIMNEKKKTSVTGTSKDYSRSRGRDASNDEKYYRHRSREKHKRRKKTRRKRGNDASDSSTCSEKSVSRHRQLSEKRRQKKRSKRKPRTRNKSTDLNDVEVIEYKMDEPLEPYRERDTKSSSNASQKSTNLPFIKAPSTSHRFTTKNYVNLSVLSTQRRQPPPSRAYPPRRQVEDPSMLEKQENLSCISSNSSGRSLKQVDKDRNRRCVLSEHNSMSDWDAVSEASSRTSGRIKKVNTQTETKQPPSVVRNSRSETIMKTDKTGGKPNKVEVTSVSKTFWTSKDNDKDDNKSLCSISTTGSIDSEKPKQPSSTKYRDKVNVDKEPGEISSSETSVA